MAEAPDPVAILQDLIRCPSVTPHEAGALDCLAALLVPHGFRARRMRFAEPGHADVDNLFLRWGDGAPHFCFAGHTDVVPPGELAAWTHPPFAADLAAGAVYGRGACDMKGSVAAFAAAAIGFAADRGSAAPGSVSLLITGDEEGPAVNGTVKMLAELARLGELPDHCLVGEPTCTACLGDTVKIGRRGSIHFEIAWTGVQGHAAYPHLAVNPIPALARLVDRLAATALDAGDEHFQPSTLAVTAFDTGNPANNVIPAAARVRFNIRYNRRHTPASLAAWVEGLCAETAAALGGSYRIAVVEGAEVFVTEPGPLVELVRAAVREVTGVEPRLDTGGGTSDARFVKDYCPVVEFGPVNATIHQVDENIPVADLVALTRVYRAVLERYFAAGPA